MPEGVDDLRGNDWKAEDRYWSRPIDSTLNRESLLLSVLFIFLFHVGSVLLV